MPRKLARALILHEGNVLLIKRRKGLRKFFTLPGGGVEKGESGEQAALRELLEESSIAATVERLIFRETDSRFGETEYYLCVYVSGEPSLPGSSPEARRGRLGLNTYEPLWVAFDDFHNLKFLPDTIGETLRRAFRTGTITSKVLEFKEGELVI